MVSPGGAPLGPIEGRRFQAEEFTRIHLKDRFLGVDLSEKGQHILPPNVVVYYLRPPTLPRRSLLQIRSGAKGTAVVCLFDFSFSCHLRLLQWCFLINTLHNV